MTKIEMIRLCLRDLKWRVLHRKRRLAMAWRYGWETMTEPEANEMAYDCALVAGIYPLESLDRNSVMEQCIDRFGETPEMAELVADACERVFSKWNSTGDSASAAEEWAIDKVVEYAEERSITLADSWNDEATAEAAD